MTVYQEISVHEAMKMVADKRVNDLYMEYRGSLECTENLKINFTDASNRKYFERVKTTK